MEATQILISDLNTTEADSKNLLPYIEELDEGLSTMINDLQEAKDFVDDVDKLDNMLNTVGDVLTGLCLIPEVDVVTCPIKNSVKVVYDEIHPVRVNLDKIDSKLESVRKNLQTVDDKVKIAIDDLQKLESGANSFANTLTTTYKCIEDTNNSALRESINTFSSALDPYDKDLNTALEASISISKSINSEIKDFEDKFKFITNMENSIKSEMSTLNVISDMLKPIQNVLNQKITVPYGVKMTNCGWKVWKCKVKTVNFTFTVNDIFEGIDTGISFVNDQLMKLAKQALNAVNLNLPSLPTIPGLSELKSTIEGLNTTLTTIDDNLNKLSTEFDTISKKASALESSIATFNIKC